MYNGQPRLKHLQKGVWLSVSPYYIVTYREDCFETEVK